METHAVRAGAACGRAHGSYLQGMETVIVSIVSHNLVVAHGSYLQGMETAYIWDQKRLGQQAHGSYLQGMETILNGVVTPALLRTDPTYKEWKHTSGSMEDGLTVMHGSYLQGMETMFLFSYIPS